VASYLFNSQLVSLQDGTTVLVAETRCRDHAGALGTIEMLLADRHITEVIWVDLAESMRNGGGPACLRLRVQVTAEELAAIHPGFLVDEARLAALEAWVGEHYRDRLVPADLADPSLGQEIRVALEALEAILGVPDLFSETA
jgi:succinylarginine dihydrolase